MTALRKFADFGGRARRKEYWFFVLFYAIFYIAAVVADIAIGSFDRELTIGFLSGLYSLAMIVPYLAAAVRRLHDTDRRGWWLLLVFIPILGAIFLLCLLAIDGQPGEKRFGPDPKRVAP